MSGAVFTFPETFPYNVTCLRKGWVYMTRKLDFAIVGGDVRHAQLANFLADDGHRVFVYALKSAELSDRVIREDNLASLSKHVDCVILPIPLQNETGHLNTPLSDKKHELPLLFSLLSTGQMVIGGKITNDVFELAAKCGIRLFDCLEREDFTVMNALPTAEGAIGVAMNLEQTTLNRKNVLVLGFGHIGKLLSAKLYGLGAKVTASARKSGDLAWISSYGYDAINTHDVREKLSEFDIIFNTIPSKILDREALLQVKKNSLIIDLASRPGGVDFEAARELDLRVSHALSLPGKVAPVTAAESLRTTVYNILDEWGK